MRGPQNLLAMRTALVFLLFSLSFPLMARHIIGGSMTYKNLGNGDYEITLKMYRDCFCTACAQLDPVAYIGIYRCGGGTNCNTQRDAFARLDVPLTSRRNVTRPDYPCLEPPNVCVEEGIYIFRLSTYRVNLPLSTESYHITYQRCCRNVTINNIVNPGSWGATYTVEITPEAQTLGSSSPAFNTFPPTVVCADFNLRYDHAATDADGDSLVYELCPPLAGGGNNLDEFTYTTCVGAYPRPGCPPPYSSVPFRPPYSAAVPIGGTPGLAIDPVTGLMTGKPSPIGQYVVGVCVLEFRKGVLLSKTFRDFQFNVARCDQKINADIKEDRKIADQEYEVNSCGPTVIKFLNESSPRSSIRTTDWEFTVQGRKINSNDWEPQLTFPGVGKYSGLLIVNKGTECGDTARIEVNIFPDLEADFVYKYDTCEANFVEFIDKSVSGSKLLSTWRWSFGDGGSSRLQNPKHTYTKPGKIPVTLTVRDTNKCVESITKNINYFPVPAVIVIAPSASDACVPSTITFKNLSTPIDSTYKINWNFGDGGTSNRISPTHTFKDPGTFNVTVDLVSPIGCKTDTSFKNLIRVRPSPKADFDIDPQSVSILTPNVRLVDKSEGASRVLWKFSDGRSYADRNPVFLVRDTGQIRITQTVINSVNCVDTLLKILDVKPEIRYFLPNAFTPNGDSKNDEFKGVGITRGIREFKMGIWTRWGELVFETEDPNEAWNGRRLNAGQEAPMGVYVVLVTYRDPRGKPAEIKSFVTLVR
jgi:gliding motility-associated-like protein